MCYLLLEIILQLLSCSNFCLPVLLSCFTVLYYSHTGNMIMRMSTKQPNVLIPLQLILIVIALYAGRQLQHCKSVTDIDVSSI